MTQTMRERLIVAFMAETKRQGVWTYFHEWVDESPVETPSPRNMHIQSEVDGGGLDVYALLDAVLAELREPDEAMIHAGRYSAMFDRILTEDGEEGPEAVSCFTAMIDAVSSPTLPPQEISR